MRLAGEGLLIDPVAVVWDGPTRVALQPWIDRLDANQAAVARPTNFAPQLDPVAEWLGELQTRVGTLFVTGLRRADADVSRAWLELDRRAGQLGLVRLGATVRAVSAGLAQKVASANRVSRPTAAALLALAALARAAQEVG